MKKKLLIKRESISNNTSQSIELDYKKVFNDIPDGYVLIEDSRKYSVCGSEIIYTAEIYQEGPRPEFVETMIR